MNVELLIKKFLIDKEQERNREFGNAMKNITREQLQKIFKEV